MSEIPAGQKCRHCGLPGVYVGGYIWHPTDADWRRCGHDFEPAPTPEPPQETRRDSFWVIERFEEGQSRGYWYGNSSREFSTDIDRSLQFCRREDAVKILLSWHWKDCEATEHLYLAPEPPPTAPQEEMRIPFETRCERRYQLMDEWDGVGDYSEFLLQKLLQLEARLSRTSKGRD